MAIEQTPSGSCKAITCSDTEAIATGPCRGIIVKTAGDYTILLTNDGTSAVTVNLAAGVIHWLRVKRVNTTGAAATTGLVAIY